MRLKSLFNTALVSSIAIGMVACNQQERVNELAHGTYIEMTDSERLEKNLPVESQSNIQTGDFLQDQNTASTDWLASLVVSKDKKTITYTNVVSIYNPSSENSDSIQEYKFELNQINEKDGTYSTGVIPYDSILTVGNVESYLASKVKKEAEKKDEKEDEAEEKEEEKNPKLAAKDIEPENRYRSNFTIHAVAPQIIAVIVENTYGQANGTSLTSRTTKYYKYVINTQADEIHQAFNAKLNAKQKLAVATRTKLAKQEEAKALAAEAEAKKLAETEEAAVKAAQEADQAAEEVEKAKEQVDAAATNLEQTKNTNVPVVPVPPVEDSEEGNEQ
ncbi:MAG: hypothetical protein VX642_00475 [Bdellovibrionota bacterium]|nr:hypothetical protein [Bdellovibrionota bacterium]